MVFAALTLCVVTPTRKILGREIRVTDEDNAMLPALADKHACDLAQFGEARAGIAAGPDVELAGRIQQAEQRLVTKAKGTSRRTWLRLGHLVRPKNSRNVLTARSGR